MKKNKSDTVPKFVHLGGINEAYREDKVRAERENLMKRSKVRAEREGKKRAPKERSYREGLNRGSKQRA